MALILAFYIHRWPLLPTRHLRSPCLGLTSGYGTQARGHMDPEVACRCQLLHRQVTGVTHVRHLCIILEQLLGGGRQQPRRGSRGVPAGGPGTPRESGEVSDAYSHSNKLKGLNTFHGRSFYVCSPFALALFTSSLSHSPMVHSLSFLSTPLTVLVILLLGSLPY